MNNHSTHNDNTVNIKKEPLNQAVKKFYRRHSLSDKQLQTLFNQQIKAPTRSKKQLSDKRLFNKGMAIAASFLVFFLLATVVFSRLQTPDIVTAAYADIKLDADLNNGMQTKLSQWMQKNHIAPVPQPYKVEMSKYCQLDNYKTTHLRIAGTERGTMHVFFHRGKQPFFLSNSSGVSENMNWQLIKVRDDLSLVVLRTADMREQAVKRILGGLLPELQA